MDCVDLCDGMCVWGEGVCGGVCVGGGGWGCVCQCDSSPSLRFKQVSKQILFI